MEDIVMYFINSSLFAIFRFLIGNDAEYVGPLTFLDADDTVYEIPRTFLDADDTSYSL